MSERKTKKTGASVSAFLSKLGDTEKHRDARALMTLMQRVTGEKPKMWGPSIVGFGELLHRSDATGREGRWPVIGFSPRAQNLTLYFMAGFEKKLAPLLKRLGKHSTGSSCLYIRRLSEIDATVLEAIVTEGLAESKALDRSNEPARKKRH